MKVDKREDNRICEAVKRYKKSHKVIVEELPIGDFIFTDGKESVVFEYKTFHDFKNSVRQGRVFDQAIRQAENFTYHFIIVESGKDVKMHQIYSDRTCLEAISSLNTFTTVIMCPTQKLALKIMESQAELCLQSHPLSKRPAEKLENAAYNYLLLVKGVDRIRARSICSHLNLNCYEDLKNVTTKKLAKVPGIGAIVAQRITTSIHFDR